MKTATINLYQFSELSDKAKDLVIQKMMENRGYSWGDEAIASFEALIKHFNGTSKNYSIDWFNCSYSDWEFDMPEMERAEIERLLSELGTYNPETLRGNGDCKLTGYSADEDAIDGFRIAFLRDNVSDLNQLMKNAFHSWLNACHADCKWQYEQEQMSEHCDANDYWFDEGGDIVRE